MKILTVLFVLKFLVNLRVKTIPDLIIYFRSLLRFTTALSLSSVKSWSIRYNAINYNHLNMLLIIKLYVGSDREHQNLFYIPCFNTNIHFNETVS